MRRLLLASAAALALAACSSPQGGEGTAGSGTGGASAAAIPGSSSGSLININLSNIRAEIAKNLDISLDRVPITIQLPITIAANVCGTNVNLLTAQLNAGSNSCTATATSPALEQEVNNQIG